MSDEETPVGGLAEQVLGDAELELSKELMSLLSKDMLGDALPPVLRTSKAARAFEQAFELIGGVPRLALWADRNPSKFYAMFSKMIPATVQGNIQKDIKVTIAWASPQRLSYQHTPQGDVVDAVPVLLDQPLPH
jgi:hypothetical protein